MNYLYSAGAEILKSCESVKVIGGRRISSRASDSVSGLLLDESSSRVSEIRSVPYARRNGCLMRLLQLAAVSGHRVP